MSDYEFNGRRCPYFHRFQGLPGYDPNATCTSGCWQEPRCFTDEPTGGWPERSEPVSFDAGQFLAELQNAAFIYGTAYLKARREPDGTYSYEVLDTGVVEVREPAPKENP